MEKIFELTKEYIEEIKSVIDAKDEVKALKMLDDLHAADVAEIYDELNIEEAKFLYLLLDAEKASNVLVELEDDDRDRFLKALPSEVIAKQFISEMDTDDAADVIGDMSEEQQEEVLALIDDAEHAGDIVDLLNYDEDTAGGLMGKEYIAVQEEWNIETCIKEIRKQSEDVDEIYFVYVINKENILKGVISLKDLLLKDPKDKILSITDSEIAMVKTDTPDEEVANIMDKYDLVAIPVVDSIGRLLGRITIDDVVDVIREEAEKDYQLISGITSDVESSDSIFHLTRARLPWLVIGLFGGILGAQVISQYEGDLRIYPEMAFFIPLIAAMGGNVGIQSSSIVVQGIANNSMGLETTGTKLLKELSVGFFNGIICSALLMGINLLFTSSMALTITVSISLFIVIIFASIFGTLIPLILNKYKIDPALATGPFITTINDIMGLLLYLTIGRYIFGLISIV